ncbi:heparan-alpha-glucosaminide N-acetyltransferase domain-containing protein [Nocardioides caldifontis]|uniref:heparan-alpha-glucosaminide N-acetyltransferase domain-containing protein n=1 Tax=Nocardioides caldifontis TaxID=2588938 RepID=UPI0011DF272F|nr:heparan-alpha-glucosaminide N-acetyltransferase domain-containing protein [Nocardioides caldifontis]
MTPAGAGRVVGVDAARCLALVGMMATHILPGTTGGEVPLAHQVAGGRASALFAVLAGVSLVLLSGTRAPLRGADLAGMLAGTAVRAAWVALVGLVIGGLDTGIAVILVNYALLFLVAAPFLALRTWVVGTVAVVWAAAGPVVSLLWRRDLPWASYDVPSFDSLSAPGTVLRELVVTGYYPVLTWVPYLLVGIVVGRLDLRSVRTALVLVGVGAWAAVTAWAVSDTLVARPDARAAMIRTFEGSGWRGDLSTTLTDGLYGVVPTGSWWWLAVRSPHTGTSLDLMMTIGSALLVLGACLLLARPAPRVTAVLLGAGAMTLTLYTLHVVLRTDGWWDEDTTGVFLGQVALVVAIGAVYRLARRQGPLERVVAVTGGAVRRAVTRGFAGRR